MIARIFKPIAAGFAVGGLFLSLTADLPAQTGTKNAAGTKKKPIVVPAQADDDEKDDDAPPPPRRKPSADAATTGDAAPAKNSKPAKDKSAGESKTNRPEKPAPQEFRLEKLSPELEKVLKDWEKKTSQFKKLRGEFTVFKYEKTFEIEKRGTGKFVHEAPDKGFYELKGAEIQKTDKSSRKNSEGEKYTLQSDTPVTWICTGKEIYRIDEKDKTFEKIPIPAEAQGEKIIEGPLPFLFGMKVEQARMRYKMKLIDQKNPKEIWLEVIPLRNSDEANWNKAVVIIDAERFVPKAVKLLDPTDCETVHMFSKVEVNPKEWFFPKDPFKPDLKKYKEVMTNDAQASKPTVTPAGADGGANRKPVKQADAKRATDSDTPPAAARGTKNNK